MKKTAPALAAAMVMLACSLPSGLSAGSSHPPTATASPPAATETRVPPTPAPASPTPLPPTINAETVAGLSRFMSFADGELVRSLAFSPDGTALAAAVGDEAGTIRLYEAAYGLPLRTLEGHKSIVWGLAFSPDGRLLASASRDQTAKVWDWRNGSLLQTLDAHPTVDGQPADVVSVAFSPDSRTLAIGGVDQWPNAAIWTYKVDSWESVLKLAEFWNIPGIAYSPDGTLIVGGGTSRNVRVWRTTDGGEVFILYHAGQVSDVVVSPDGSTVATGLCEASDAQTSQCTRGAVWLWDLATGKLIHKLSDFPEWVEGVAFSVDGSMVIAGSRDGTLRAYATADFRPLLITTSPRGTSPTAILALTLSPDGRFVATGGVGKINLWRVEP